MGLIRSLHNGMKARVSFDGTLSEEMSINNGVKQGDISAPMLFNIYFAIVFLVAFNDNSTVSTSDIGHIAVFLMSVDYSLKEKSLLHW